MDLMVSITLLGDMMFKINNVHASNCRVFTFKNIKLLIAFNKLMGVR